MISPNLLPRLLAGLARGLPDAVMAGFLAILWVKPQWLWPTALKTGLLVVMVEAFLMHATALIGGLLLSARKNQGPTWEIVTVGTLAYLGFIGTIAWDFREWWPLLAVAWLLASKLRLLARPVTDVPTKEHMQTVWQLGAMTYMAALFLALMLPVPRLGLVRPVVAAAEIPGSFAWITKPHAAIALGVIYFSVLALAKSMQWRWNTETEHDGEPA